MFGWIVVWSNRKCRGNNVSTFDTEDEAMAFAEMMKSTKDRWSVIVCEVKHQDGGEVKIEKSE